MTTSNPTADNSDRLLAAAVTITANQWATVADDVVAGRCVVYFAHLEVYNVNEHHHDMYMVHGTWWSEELGTSNGHLLAAKDDLLEIEWLTPQPALASEQETAGGEAEPDFHDLYIQASGTLAIVASWLRGEKGSMGDLSAQQIYDMIAYEQGLNAEVIIDPRSQLATAEGEVQALQTALEFYSSFDYEYIPLDEDKGKRAQVALAARKPLSADADEGGGA